MTPRHPGERINWNLCQCCGQELPPEQRKPLYDPGGDTERLCFECGHPYYRHFDSYNDMEPVGCKYCECRVFVERPDGGAEKGLDKA